jgi:DNA-binding response OmpR family regulator
MWGRLGRSLMGISPATIKGIDYPARTVRCRQRESNGSRNLRSEGGTMRLLIIDEDQKAAHVLAKGLRDERFVVDIAHTGAAGDDLATVNTYDLIVLGWVLPDKSGITVCGDLRARGISTPIVMLTARDSLEDRVTGLNTGADDYLTKPFAFDELLARIRALLRRSNLTRQMVLRVADLTLDPTSHQVMRGGRTIHVTRTEYAILAVLMRHAGAVVGRTQLTQSVWESNADSLFNVLAVHVSNLRGKLDVAGGVPLIRTMRGSGYVVGPPEQ